MARRSLGELLWVWFLLPSILVFTSQPTADSVDATSSSLNSLALQHVLFTGAAPPSLPDAASIRRCNILVTRTLNPLGCAFVPSGDAPIISGLPLTTARPNTSPASGFIPYEPSPTHLGGLIQPLIPQWSAALSLYPDPTFVSILIKIFRNGASLGVKALQRPIIPVGRTRTCFPERGNSSPAGFGRNPRA